MSIFGCYLSDDVVRAFQTYFFQILLKTHGLTHQVYPKSSHDSDSLLQEFYHCISVFDQLQSYKLTHKLKLMFANPNDVF